MVHVSGRLDRTAHTRQPWRIHAIAKDFRLEDVWALPARGGPEDFPRLLSLIRSLDPAETSPVVRALFAVRWQLGAWLGMDRSDAGLDARVESLRTRLPDDLVGDTDPAIPETLPFRPLYLTDREAAFEIANTTMHGVMHVGWVPDEAGGYRGQMAVLVKPNGLVGRAYMAAIAPFRHVVVYPQLLRSVSRRWRPGAEQVAAPESIRASSTLPRVDYADTFLMDTSAHPDWTARSWAREILEGAPATTRAELLAGWSALGLKSTDSGESVLGWEIRRQTPESVLLARDSRIGMPGELLFALSPEGLQFATFVYHRTAATRVVWAAVQGTHVRTVLDLLDRAARGSVAVTLNAGN
jgi:hypothetical protein